MSYKELKTKLDWFVKEKGQLEDAEDDMRAVHTLVGHTTFMPPGDGSLLGVKAALDDARSAILDEANVSLDAGADLLEALAEAIRLTGRNYVTMESKNTDYAQQIQFDIAAGGL